MRKHEIDAVAEARTAFGICFSQWEKAVQKAGRRLPDEAADTGNIQARRIGIVQGLRLSSCC
jgi:hypothetical protein